MRDLREYFRPRSAEEAVEIKNRYGARAVYLGGGSDLLVEKRRGVEAAIDIRRCGIEYVDRVNGTWLIGGGALLRDVERELAEVGHGMLRDAVRHTAPWLIRNAATLAGNIANASPAADSVPALLALDAELALLGDAAETVPLAGVIEGPHRTKLGDRLIQEIRISQEAAMRRGIFVKLDRSASDIALVNLAVALRHDGEVVRDVRIALGAVAPTPMRALRAESLVEGQRPTPELLHDVEQIVQQEVQPITDWRATEEYRRRMSGVLVRRALERVALGQEP